MDEGYLLVMAMVAIALMTVFLAFMADANADADADEAKEDTALAEPAPHTDTEENCRVDGLDHGDMDNVNLTTVRVEIETPDSGEKGTTAP